MVDRNAPCLFVSGERSGGVLEVKGEFGGEEPEAAGGGDEGDYAFLDQVNGHFFEARASRSSAASYILFLRLVDFASLRRSGDEVSE